MMELHFAGRELGWRHVPALWPQFHTECKSILTQVSRVKNQGSLALVFPRVGWMEWDESMAWILTRSCSITQAVTSSTASLSLGPQLSFDDLCGKGLKLPLQTPHCSRQGCRVLVAPETFKVKSTIVKFNKAAGKNSAAVSSSSTAGVLSWEL